MKWFINRLFDEFEPRDLVIIIVVVGIFLLCKHNKIQGDQMEMVFTALGAALGGYLLGRPTLQKKKREGEDNDEK